MDSLELLVALLKCKSVTPNDDGALKTLGAALQAIGFNIQYHTFSEPGYPDITNLYAKFGEGDALAFAGHTDVVPSGDEKLWSHPPFEGVVDNHIIMGRGVVDMKGAIAAFYGACRQYIASGGTRPLAFVVTGDEEAQAVNGTCKLLKLLHEKGERFTQIIVGEPTNPERVGEMIKIGRRGSASFRLTVVGKEGHVAYPHLALNPVPLLAKCITHLSNIELDSGTQYFDKSNLEVIKLELDNAALNVIPQQASAVFNVRFNDSYSSTSLENRIRSEVDTLGVNYKLLMLDRPSESFVTKPNEFINKVVKLIESIVGFKPVLSTTGGTSDARFIKDYAPVFEFGLVNKTAHKIDECASVNDISLLKKIYLEIIKL